MTSSCTCLICLLRSEEGVISWSYGWLWATVWVLWLKHRSSPRAACVLNCLVISPAPALVSCTKKITNFYALLWTPTLITLLPGVLAYTSSSCTQNAEAERNIAVKLEASLSYKARPSPNKVRQKQKPKTKQKQTKTPNNKNLLCGTYLWS